MRKSLILPLLFVFALGFSVPMALAQTTGTVKGACKNSDGSPIVGAEVEWTGTESGHTYKLKTNNKGEYFSLGIVPGKYNVKLSKDGKELFHINGVMVGLEETELPFDLKKEQVKAAEGQGMTAEQAKAKADAATKAAAENKTVGSLNDKLNAAKVASDAGDYDTAIATLNEANQIDSTRDLIWFKLGDAYRISAAKQTDPEEKKKRYESASTDYQKAIELHTAALASKTPTPDDNLRMAAYYNNLAEVDAKSQKTDDSITNYEKAAQLDPAHAATYLFNEGAVLTNAGKIDQAIAAFDKVIAADPTKADAYYWKGVNLIGKATLKGDKMVAPDGTAQAFQKYLELQPDGKLAQPAKDMLASIGASVETGYGKKKPAK
jgi:tetratricopeptide (TPR) repeat protein